PSFFFNPTAPTSTYTLSLHDALPIFFTEDVLAGPGRLLRNGAVQVVGGRDVDHLDIPAGEHFFPVYGVRLEAETFLPFQGTGGRSEEHTSELQSRENLVCRLLLEKKK